MTNKSLSEEEAEPSRPLHYSSHRPQIRHSFVSIVLWERKSVAVALMLKVVANNNINNVEIYGLFHIDGTYIHMHIA